MNIAITGATGFIGEALVEKNIRLNNKIRILTRRNHVNFSDKVEIFNGDLSFTKSKLDGFFNNIDIFYHCAAELENDQIMHEVNVNGTKKLLELAHGKIKKWVQLSSTGVYGNPQTGRIDENSVENPKNAYERTKLQADNLVIEAGKNGLVNYTILRPSNVFGPTMRNQSLFQLIKAIDKGYFFYIGKSGASANYIHVDNVIEALILCGTNENANSKVFNLSDWRTIESFTQSMALELKKKSPILRLPKNILKLVAPVFEKIPGIPFSNSRIDALTSNCIYNFDLIQKVLGYNHVVTMEQGITSLVNAYKQKNT